MKRSDDVFLFTLVDFLLQALFFGFFLYVVGKALAPAQLSKSEREARAALLEKTKVSDLIELTDLLSKMGPLEKLPGTAEFFQKNGGVVGLRVTLEAMQQIGGADTVRTMQAVLKAKEQEIDGLKTEIKAWGTPSCLYETVSGKVRPRSIARVRVYDDRVELDTPTDDMRSVLTSLKLDYETVKTLGHSAFRATFAPLVVQRPECRYFLEVTVRPKLYSSMQVVWSSFRTQ